MVSKRPWHRCGRPPCLPHTSQRGIHTKQMALPRWGLLPMRGIHTCQGREPSPWCPATLCLLAHALGPLTGYDVRAPRGVSTTPRFSTKASSPKTACSRERKKAPLTLGVEDVVHTSLNKSSTIFQITDDKFQYLNLSPTSTIVVEALPSSRLSTADAARAAPTISPLR